MATEVVMPNAGFDTQEARILEWLVKPGDTISKGDVIAVIESDKANVELESIASGKVLALLYEVNIDVPIGATIARIGSPDEMPAVSTATKATKGADGISDGTDGIYPVPTSLGDPSRISPLARRVADEHRVDVGKITGTGARGRIKREDVERHLKPANGNGGGEILALPKVRRAAREAGIDLAAVTPSGAAGQITMGDLEAYQSASTVDVGTGYIPSDVPTAPPVSAAVERDGVTEVPLSRMRQIIGSRLQKSKVDAPHFYVTGEFDLEAAVSSLNALPEPRPRLNDLIQYVTVRTLMRVPELNATFEDGHLYHHEAVNLAIAVAREDGLLTPVVQGADRFSLEGLAKESKALIKRTRENRLQATDLSGGTFTISNLGIIPQVDQFTAVINPPQVAILAVGTVKQRPVIVNGGIFAHHTVHLTVSGDHRVVDGIHLGQFLAAFQQELDQFSR